MLTDLITLGPEPDKHEGNSVLHLTHITCNNANCAVMHGAANFTSAIPLHVPITDTPATTLQECIARNATIHNPTEYRCITCGNQNTSHTEQYLPMGQSRSGSCSGGSRIRTVFSFSGSVPLGLVFLPRYYSLPCQLNQLVELELM